jgi:hypothetical protein
MLPDEPFDAALADAVALGQLPLRRSSGEGGNELFGLGLGEPVPNSPLPGAQRGAHAVRRFASLGLRLPKLCEFQPEPAAS